MMVTSSALHTALNDYAGYAISLNDVCVYVPAAFSVLSVLFTFGLALEASGGALNSSLFAAGFMAIMPAHLMRSVAGGYDNESIAVAAMCLTFWLWVRALRAPGRSWPLGALCGRTRLLTVYEWSHFRNFDNYMENVLVF